MRLERAALEHVDELLGGHAALDAEADGGVEVVQLVHRRGVRDPGLDVAAGPREPVDQRRGVVEVALEVVGQAVAVELGQEGVQRVPPAVERVLEAPRDRA